MKTKCIIIDDEPLARSLLRNHISKIENLEIVAECADAMKALQVLRDNKVDIMFIDIEMPQITGIEFLKILKNPPVVIITSAYGDYALHSFELDVLDYLLKPITFERFLKAVNKYYRENKEKNEDSYSNSGLIPAGEPFIYVKENKRLIKINLDEILYIEGLSEYVQIYTDRKKFITKTSLTSLEEKLPSGGFLRIHKSFIVSLSRIESFTSSTIEIPGKELPIGRSYKNPVINALQLNVNAAQ